MAGGAPGTFIRDYIGRVVNEHDISAVDEMASPDYRGTGPEWQRLAPDFAFHEQIYRADGEVRTGLIDEIAHAIDPARLIFEAPLRDQQVWLLKRFGTECNLGNIAPGDVLSLETLRLGLRSDTVEHFARGDGD